jgi:replication factor C subunit 3/5
MNSFIETQPLLNDLDFKSELLENLIKNNNIFELPNLIFYGTNGSGKSIKVYAFLASLLKSKEIYDIRTKIYEEDRKEIFYRYSPFHIEFSPLDLASYENIFFHGFLKEYIQTLNIGLQIPKIVYIKNAENLSFNSQAALRRMMEKSNDTCRFIFECNNVSGLIEPLRSRCLLIRISFPNIVEIRNSLKNISEKNFGKKLTNDELDKCIELSKNFNKNLKHINGILRCYLITGEWVKLSYIDKIEELCSILDNFKNINNTDIERIRDIVNELYIQLVPANEIMNFIFKRIIGKYKNNQEFCYYFIDMYAKQNVNMELGNKKSLHIESFILNCLNLLFDFDFIQNSSKNDIFLSHNSNTNIKKNEVELIETQNKVNKKDLKKNK